MYKRVDVEDEVVEGFSYRNHHGEIEIVGLDLESTLYVSINSSEGDVVHLYKEDIPKLIKALQAAYDHKQEK